jgi:hypothetical protein
VAQDIASQQAAAAERITQQAQTQHQNHAYQQQYAAALKEAASRGSQQVGLSPER